MECEEFVNFAKNGKKIKVFYTKIKISYIMYAKLLEGGFLWNLKKF